jgi:hypothetical protein
MDIPGKVVVQDTAAQQARIELNGDTADATVGGAGRGGDLRVIDTDDKQRIHVGLISESGPIDPTSPTQPPLVASYWGLKVQTDKGTSLIQLGRVPVHTGPAQSAPTISFILGGAGHTGIVEIRDHEGDSRMRLGKGHLTDDTVLELRNASNQKTVSLEAEGRVRLLSGSDPVARIEASSAAIYLGGHGKAGDAFLFATAGDNTTAAQATIHLNGVGGKITLRSNDQQDRMLLDGGKGDAWLGGKGVHGDVMLFHKDQPDNRDSAKATVRLAGATGELTLRSPDGKDRVLLDGSKGDLWLGGKDARGDIMLFHPDEQNNRDLANATIRLDGEDGDIILRNADCAEDFDIADANDVSPGTVMTIGEDGRLLESWRPYDRCVAGVLSGAGDLKPGIVLGRHEETPGRRPIALTGRAWCRVEGRTAPIAVGDLLTTSSIPGVAMKAADPTRAFGAVIGKALAPFASGEGSIPILVALQ